MTEDAGGGDAPGYQPPQTFGEQAELLPGTSVTERAERMFAIGWAVRGDSAVGAVALGHGATTNLGATAEGLIRSTTMSQAVQHARHQQEEGAGFFQGVAEGYLWGATTSAESLGDLTVLKLLRLPGHTAEVGYHVATGGTFRDDVIAWPYTSPTPEAAARSYVEAWDAVTEIGGMFVGGTWATTKVPKAVAPIPKFSEYVFKEGAPHGKAKVFENLGWAKTDSAKLAQMWEAQGAARRLAVNTRWVGPTNMVSELRSKSKCPGSGMPPALRGTLSQDGCLPRTEQSP